MQRILVIGGSGTLGAPVARQLRARGFQVRVLSRDPERAKRAVGPDCEVSAGDVRDVGSLKAAMDGCQAVHYSVAGPDERVGMEHVVEVARAAGVERVTYVSGTSVAEETTWFPQTRRKFLAERAVRESGIPYGIFCPTWFMETLPRFVKGSKAYVFGEQRKPYHFLAARDFARMVATFHELPEAPSVRLVVHGPEGLTFHEALRRYCAVAHPEIRDVTTMPLWLAKSIGLLPGKRRMREIAAFMGFFEKVGELGDSTEANELLGRPETTLEAWLAARRASAT